MRSDLEIKLIDVTTWEEVSSIDLLDFKAENGPEITPVCVSSTRGGSLCIFFETYRTETNPDESRKYYNGTMLGIIRRDGRRESYTISEPVDTYHLWGCYGIFSTDERFFVTSFSGKSCLIDTETGDISYPAIRNGKVYTMPEDKTNDPGDETETLGVCSALSDGKTLLAYTKSGALYTFCPDKTETGLLLESIDLRLIMEELVGNGYDRWFSRYLETSWIELTVKDR